MWETKFLAMTNKVFANLTSNNMHKNVLKFIPSKLPSLYMLYYGVFKTHLRELNTFWELFLQYCWHKMRLFVCYIMESSILESWRPIWKNWIHFNNSFSYIVGMKKSVISCKHILKKELSKCIQFSQMGLEDSYRNYR